MASQTSLGQLFVVSAPSGVGKTTIIRSALTRLPTLHYSISCTTRQAREGEVDGQDYHFITRKRFQQGIAAGRFLEWAEVHGNFYGTDGEPIRQWLDQGEDVLLDIDVQGARQVRCTYPASRTIFILPPSIEELLNRLKGRGTESEEQLARRMRAAHSELGESPWYEYIVVNDRLEDAVEDFLAILRACRCERFQQANRIRPFLVGIPS
ncbi:MAG: guanylate kinase [Syntrophobacteraceae bacterium]